MATLFPDLSVINKLKVSATDGELYLCTFLKENLGDDFDIFFNPYLDGDRPDIIILKKGCGAIIVEVKDWNLDCYTIDQNNQWSVEHSRVRSPFSQVFKYKSNFFDLHLPTLGLKEALNKSFFRVISCFVYFHLGTKEKFKTKYDIALSQINNELNINNDDFKNKKINHGSYEKKRLFLQNKKSQVNRDFNLLITKDNVNKLLNKIKDLSSNQLFTDEIYSEFVRRLNPPEQVLEQGVKLNYDKKQLKLIDSINEFKKVKGVAGCGKTTVIAKRAVNAYKRHNSPILILTFNITLKHYIKDKISDVREGVEFNNFEITNYHQFFNSQLNNLNIDISEFLEKQYAKNLSQEDVFDILYKTDFFKGLEIEKYHTILLDEIQDYESEWVKIIRDNFLETDGEMLLFGDQSQNIYEREINKRESSIVQGFGRWVKLTKSYRSDIDSPLVNLFKKFQQKFLIEKYQDSEIFDSELSQSAINFDILKYHTIQDLEDSKKLYLAIVDSIKVNKFIPNDTTILCSSIELLRNLNSLFNINEKTMIMFENLEEYYQIIGVSEDTPINEKIQKERLLKKDLEKIRRRKKNFFMQNSGLIKISTTHSFKGLESPNVFCILQDNDSPEIIYTAMTRAKKNLIIFDTTNSTYSDFFDNQHL
ncbi:NERD domain-containing protein [Pseudoalteromonas sp. RB2-MNA-CIBAN-0110]|uniref:nuclease-related domain-containing DEAD/DEAH box helicase n=1 Tax=Pseudoalteromonas sp. RB2-MNA-CIBAN-0110 TaxID=3140439 RepID=UPI00331D9505